MKKVLFPLMIVFLTLSTLPAQEILAPDKNDSLKLEFRYTPSLNETAHFTTFDNMVLPGKRTFTSILSVFEGVKYRGVTDQFQSISPFDFRSFHSHSFTELSILAKRNQLISNSLPVYAW